MAGFSAGVTWTGDVGATFDVVIHVAGIAGVFVVTMVTPGQRLDDRLHMMSDQEAVYELVMTRRGRRGPPTPGPSSVSRVWLPYEATGV